MVFLDTPGLHKPRNRLGNYMIKSVTESVSGVDACLLVVEAGKAVTAADQELIGKFQALGMPALLAINKIDTIRDKSVLREQITEYTNLFDFEAVVLLFLHWTAMAYLYWWKSWKSFVSQAVIFLRRTR